MFRLIRVQSLSINRFRNYHHMVKRKSTDHKLLQSMKSIDLECTNRKFSDHRGRYLTMLSWFLPLVIILKMFGPHQIWLFDKWFDFKLFLFNLLSKEKLKVDPKYLEEEKIEQSLARKMCERKDFVRIDQKDEVVDSEEEPNQVDKQSVDKQSIDKPSVDKQSVDKPSVK